jgi:hypothetical protein
MLASMSARKPNARTVKHIKDTQVKAKRLMREMLVTWKRNEREERDVRKREQKEAVDRARVEEEKREAGRQARKLEFLISQTELYSHFVGNKLKSMFTSFLLLTLIHSYVSQLRRLKGKRLLKKLQCLLERTMTIKLVAMNWATLTLMTKIRPTYTTMRAGTRRRLLQLHVKRPHSLTVKRHWIVRQTRHSNSRRARPIFEMTMVLGHPPERRWLIVSYIDCQLL